MRFLPYGDRAVLIELDSLSEVHQLQQAVRRAGLGVDTIPGWRTLLVSTQGTVPDLIRDIRALSLVAPVSLRPDRHVVPVVYDGIDLGSVAEACGVKTADVVRLHQSVDYRVAFLGFTRGFPYLAGLPEVLTMPRLSAPRLHVPAGSVAIALDQCGIYPTASPGGWHLIGTTVMSLFDPDQEPPTNLSPGDTVRFVEAQS